jgi:hypothetical protein
MAAVVPKLYLESGMLDLDIDTVKRAIGQVVVLMRRYPKMSAFIETSTVRANDFSVTLETFTPKPEVVVMVALPGAGRTPIVTTLFEQKT